MEWNNLYTQINQPSVEDMAEFIGGDSKRIWNSLFEYMENNYGAKPKLSYSGCSGKPGWNVKFQKSGQSFGTLYPEEGFFTVFIVISYKYTDEMELLRNDLSAKMRSMYDSALDYMKMGKWMMFPILDDEDLQDYKILMSVKMKPKR